jgi:two-component system KDP operon response regulator KdpE
VEGSEGIEEVENESPDIVLLDLGLPDIDGFDVLHRIRLFSTVPIIIITAREQEMDRVRGLEVGADDYIAKPFSYLELLARVNAVLRRSTGAELAPSKPFVSGKLSIDFSSQEVYLGGKAVKLTSTEYRLLCYLANNARRTVSQRTLLQKVWGPEYVDTPEHLKVHIHNLRHKLGDNPPRLIITEPGRGYKFVPP